MSKRDKRRRRRNRPNQKNTGTQGGLPTTANEPADTEVSPPPTQVISGENERADTPETASPSPAQTNDNTGTKGSSQSSGMRWMKTALCIVGIALFMFGYYALQSEREQRVHMAEQVATVQASREAVGHLKIKCPREKPCPIEIPVVLETNAHRTFSQAMRFPGGGGSWCMHWVVPPKFEPFLKVRLDGGKIHPGATVVPRFNLKAELNIVAPGSAAASLPVGETIGGEYSLWKNTGRPCFG